MGNLIPEPRTDRTGRTQIRWVRSLFGRGHGKPIPPPVGTGPRAEALGRGEARRGLLRSLSARLGEAVQEAGLPDPEGRRRRAYRDMSKLGNETLAAFDRALREHSGRVRHLPFVLNTMVTEMGWKTEDDLLAAVAVIDCFGDLPVSDTILSVSKGLREYEWLFMGPDGQPEDLARLQGQNLKVARALCRVTEAVFAAVPERQASVNREEHSGRYLTDRQFVEAVAAHPERAADIADLVRSRATADGSVIAEFLANAPALADGAL